MTAERITEQEQVEHINSETKYPHLLLKKIPPLINKVEFELPGTPEVYLTIERDEKDNPRLRRNIRFLDENGNAVLNKTNRTAHGPGKPVSFSEDDVRSGRYWFYEYRNNFPQIYYQRSSVINTLPEPRNIDENLKILEKKLGLKPLE